jgi:hypothetical protein
MSRWLDLPICEFPKGALTDLLEELTAATGVEHQGSPMHFTPFLIHCLHPQGGGTPRVLLHQQRTRPGYLERRIDKIENQQVQELFKELAAIIFQHYQMHESRKLMAFFNLVVRTLEKKRPKRKR